MSKETDWKPLAEFIRQNLSADPTCVIRHDTPLLTSGIVDSFSAHALMRHIETTYGLEIPAKKRTERNFDTIDAMLELVRSLQ